MLGLFGLATRRQFERAVDRKQRWHGMVRNVFVPYYLKFQETSLAGMPELPARYSEEWVRHVEDELAHFLQQDLQPVGDLLEAAGFGTGKWERLQENGFAALGRLLDRYADGEDLAVSDDDIADAVRADVHDLLIQYPDLAVEVARRIDPDTGALTLTPEDVDAAPVVRDLRRELDQAQTELRRFRRGGQRALERIHELQTQLHLSPNGNGSGSGTAQSPVAEDEQAAAREIAGLRKDLRARDHRIAALREQLETLEGEVAERADPDGAHQEQLAALQSELDARDAQVVRQQERLERLEEEFESRGSAEPPEDMRQLRNDLAAREHTIETLREQLEAARVEGAAEGRGDGDGETIDPDELHQLRNDLAAREHTIETLREQLEASGEDEPSVGTGDAPEEEGDLRQLRNDLRAREHAIETLQEQLAKAQRDAEAAAPRPRPAAGEAPPTGPPAAAREREPGPDLEQEQVIEGLQRDLKAREHTIQALRGKLETFEKELGQARERLVEQVRKLAALTEGEIEIKPSDELDHMDADQLLDYARDVAEDLDVRRQTLDEGLQGVESVKDSYEDTRRVFEDQQRQMEGQLEQLRSEVEDYREKDQSRPEGTDDDLRDTISQQRKQLELLSTRVRQLLATNKDLNESNKKIYSSLEEAAKRVIPLRRQIEELETLQETLQRYIRQKFDRTFTMRKLQEAGLHR